MIDGWTRQLIDRWGPGHRLAPLRQSLMLVAVVCGTTLALGFVAGVGVGVLLSMLVFVRSMNRRLLRARLCAAELPSRRLRPPLIPARALDPATMPPVSHPCDDPATVAVIDFETTGMSPAQGARATEIGVVLVRDGRVVDRFASLMRSGAWVPPFIERLTGISNRMLAAAPSADSVMREVAAFTHGCALVAHNAAFDRSFWRHEMAVAGVAAFGEVPPFGCTLLLSRRLYPEAPNHRLGTLAHWHGIAGAGRAHRALADAEVATELWRRIVHDVQRRYSASVPFGLLCALQRSPRSAMGRCVERFFAEGSRRSLRRYTAG